jgi:hypoxanthine phosphoribosyltransferase
MENIKSLFFKDRQDINGEVVNSWKLIMTDTEISTIVKKCAAEINQKFQGKPVVVVGILNGAAYFFVDLTRQLTIPYSAYFIHASSYHDSQTQSDSISISSIEPSKFDGKYVILLDELFDNGHTLSEVKTAIQTKANVQSDMIYTCTIFRKSNKNSPYELPNLSGIIVPNIWLVGYGLDDRQEKRGWSHLFACPKCDGVEKSADDAIFESDIEYDNMRNDIFRQL